MERGLILLLAALMVYVAPGVQGTEVNITRAGCGVTKMCVETPLNCDPTGLNSCLFVSVVASKSVDPTDLSFELSGNSTGYIAVGLSAEPSEATTMFFICAQNETFLFQRNNTDALLTPTEMMVTKTQGRVTGNLIQCMFTVPNMHSTTYSILLGTGNFDGKTFGPFNISLDSGALNLTNPLRNTATTTANSHVSMDTGVTHSGSSVTTDPHSTASTHSGSNVTNDPHSTASTHSGSNVTNDPHSTASTHSGSNVTNDSHSTASTHSGSSVTNDSHSGTNVTTDPHSTASTHPGSSGAVDVLLLLSVLTLSMLAA